MRKANKFYFHSLKLCRGYYLNKINRNHTYQNVWHRCFNMGAIQIRQVAYMHWRQK